MGWTSFLEDIEKRLDDALHSFHLPPNLGKQPHLGIDGLIKTNDLLREKNTELLHLIIKIRDEISSKKPADFCQTECKRLKKANFDLVCRLKNLETKEEQFKFPPREKSPSQKQSNNIPSLPQHLSEAKQRLHIAEKDEEDAKKEWKKKQKAKADAQNEYQRLFQSERKSTQHIRESGIIRSIGMDRNRHK